MMAASGKRLRARISFAIIWGGFHGTRRKTTDSVFFFLFSICLSGCYEPNSYASQGKDDSEQDLARKSDGHEAFFAIIFARIRIFQAVRGEKHSGSRGEAYLVQANISPRFCRIPLKFRPFELGIEEIERHM